MSLSEKSFECGFAEKNQELPLAYLKEDVKEFIKELKEDFKEKTILYPKEIDRIINKRAGEELVE